MNHPEGLVHLWGDGDHGRKRNGDLGGGQMRLAAEGDELAFAGLVDAHHTDMSSVCFVVTGGDAELTEEAVQSAWPIARRKLHTIRDPERFVGAVVPTAGERPDLLAGRLVDSPRRSVTAIAATNPAGPSSANRRLRRNTELTDTPRSSAASPTSTSPAIRFVNTHARRRSTVVIVIVSLIAGD